MLLCASAVRTILSGNVRLYCVCNTVHHIAVCETPYCSLNVPPTTLVTLRSWRTSNGMNSTEQQRDRWHKWSTAVGSLVLASLLWGFLALLGAQEAIGSFRACRVANSPAVARAATLHRLHVLSAHYTRCSVHLHCRTTGSERQVGDQKMLSSLATLHERRLHSPLLPLHCPPPASTPVRPLSRIPQLRL